VIDVQQLHVGLDALADHRIGEVLGQADAVGLAVDAFGEALQVVLQCWCSGCGSEARIDGA